jgi:hypothetical protein
LGTVAQPVRSKRETIRAFFTARIIAMTGEGDQI